ncbi:MAG: NAD(P)-binding domain-containing protein [Pseudomonadota bacterium]
MRSIDVLIIGAGQAGLAASRCLADLGIDHLLVERGRTAERWRSERWDSLRLLTPNWMSRLPGWSYGGADPDGYMSAREVAGYLDGYARSFSAPVMDGTEVRSVSYEGGGYKGGSYVVDTSRGNWRARAVVVATGECARTAVPDFATGVGAGVTQVTADRYRNPGQLPPGGVLVIGASATGVQLAEEIHASGRPVTLSVGRHVRIPRRWRGRDVMWWLDRSGILDEPVAETGRDRLPPSLQLVGRHDHRDIDLGTLAAMGVRLVGGADAAADGVVRFRDDLARTMDSAQASLERLLSRLGAGPADIPRPLPVPGTPTRLRLRAEGIASVVWATGYRRDYPWLRVPVLDRAGEIIHRNGVTPSPGLYVLGLKYLRRRRSSFIDGVGADARFIARAIGRQLAGAVAA